MNFKKIAIGFLGIPFVVLLLTMRNLIIVDITLTVIAIMCLYEIYQALSEKYKPVKWIGYLSTISILGQHFFLNGSIINVLILTIFLSFLLLFFYIFKNKINIIDASITLFGILYITMFIAFIPLIKEMPNGHLLIWILFLSTWCTDAFAYFVGANIGKHKFTDISPKKTIEGCIGGFIGGILASIIATYIFNAFHDMNFSYITIAIIAGILSIIAQIGDLFASSIKRYCNIKDFANLIPGHGGMLDRFDSVMFAAPIAYVLFYILL